MISGRQALGSIDQALNRAREQIAAVRGQVAETAEQLLKSQQAQAEDYSKLARIRVDELVDASVIRQLDEAERQVVALLERRAIMNDELNGSISDNDKQRARLEALRHDQAAKLDAAVAVVDQAEAATQQKLDADPQYVAQRERTREAERKAMHADEKATLSEQERNDKGVAYDDPLFLYLWERSFGMPDYKGRGLFRWLDGKLARFIGYADARANFARLNEIPVRLREHATHLKELAEGEFVKLRERDESARAADGVPVLEERVAGEQSALDDIDQQIAELEQRHRSLLAEQARYATGDDPQMERAVAFLADVLQREDLAMLRHAAIRTPYPEDDTVVGRILAHERDQQQLNISIDSLKGALEQHQKQLAELEEVRVDFKRRRFDRAGSVFTNNTMVATVLGEFLAGMLDRRMLWKVLREHQRYAPHRSDPGFGSGGFGRGTVWKGGLGDLGDIIGGIGRGGFGGWGGGGGLGGGGGGFRTGGGF